MPFRKPFKSRNQRNDEPTKKSGIIPRRNDPQKPQLKLLYFQPNETKLSSSWFFVRRDQPLVVHLLSSYTLCLRDKLDFHLTDSLVNYPMIWPQKTLLHLVLHKCFCRISMYSIHCPFLFLSARDSLTGKRPMLNTVKIFSCNVPNANSCQ